MYNQKVLDIFRNPINAGGLQGANGVAKCINETFGDTVKIYLKINEDETNKYIHPFGVRNDCGYIAFLLRQFLAERFFGSCVIRNILDQ